MNCFADLSADSEKLEYIYTLGTGCINSGDVLLLPPGFAMVQKAVNCDSIGLRLNSHLLSHDALAGLDYTCVVYILIFKFDDDDALNLSSQLNQVQFSSVTLTAVHWLHCPAQFWTLPSMSQFIYIYISIISHQLFDFQCAAVLCHAQCFEVWSLKDCKPYKRNLQGTTQGVRGESVSVSGSQGLVQQTHWQLTHSLTQQIGSTNRPTTDHSIQFNSILDLTRTRTQADWLWLL